MNIIFLGTPKFAVKPLQALLDAGHNIVGVVTQIDKANARGNKIVYSPVKEFAMQNNLPLFQFKSIRKEGVDVLKSLNADVMITASYGQMLSKEIIDICKYGILNIHGSILPAYRGASPVLQALLDGQAETGVTIMRTNIGLDDGPMLLKKYVKIEYDDNQQTLMDKLSTIGAEAICEVLNNIDYYFANQELQDDTKATHCTKVSKDDAKLDFNKDANILRNEIRAYYGNPTSYFIFNEMLYKVFNADVAIVSGKRCGEIVSFDKSNGFVIACKNGGLKINIIQKQGSKMLGIKDFMNGNKFEVGQIIE